ncbi:MAG: ATP-binding protein [Sulfurimonas sp.]|nr:ATP-binding protein [Sulfurimonas sp.]MDQ7062107.1 ATP-binding protein [Sulfurimonas sp.]
MINILPNLIKHQNIFKLAKKDILRNWIYSDSPKRILKLHNIDSEVFIEEYGSGVFDYFIGVLTGKLAIGDCPVMHRLLVYLKDRETSSDEVFELCSHFRKAMIDYTYERKIASQKMLDEILFMFDSNLRGVLQFYTNSIFKKLVDAKHEAIVAVQAKDYFLSNMSHEIRTPLNAILGFVNLMLNEEITKKQATYLDIIQNSGENLLSIINDILDFSKLRSGEFSVEAKFFSIHDELTHTMELFVASATSKNITITSFIDPLIPKELFADSLRIKQILSNFLSNAIKFTPTGGVISVEATCINKILKMSVTDNGIGIDEKDIKNIFTAFAQAQFTEMSSTYTGTGLGLSISQQLAELMDGTVSVESRLGVGSTFCMSIPIDIHTNQCKIFDDISSMEKLKIGLYTKSKAIPFQFESLLQYGEVFNMNMTLINSFEKKYDIFIFIHEDVDFKLEKTILDSSSKFIALMSKDYDAYDHCEHVRSMCFPLYCSKIYMTFDELLNKRLDYIRKENASNEYSGHILVAEDNEANQELIKIILTRYGLTYDLASNGSEAIELYKKNNYDLILMDEQMPIMDGNEAVLKIIKYENDHGLHHVPISALTANVIKGAKERGLLNGFDSFLGKPIIIKDLERVFSLYLKVISTVEELTPVAKIQEKTVSGLEMSKLKEELLFTNDEIIMLVNLFIKKMDKTIPQLREAIESKDYNSIAKLAHSIKGSSANFRLESLQISADELEKRARENNDAYDFMPEFVKIKNIMKGIKIL